MRRRNHVIPFLMLIAALVLLPWPADAAGPHQHDIRWVSSTPLVDLPAAYLAENPEHGFDAWIAPDGVRARATDASWQVGLVLVAVGRDGAMKASTTAGVEAHGNRAELHRGSLTEWYINDERGLEQGFTLEKRPPGAGELVLELELTGDLMALVAGNGRRLDLLRPGNPLPILHYTGLMVVDAEGSAISARLELGSVSESGSRGLRIVVDDTDAVYPLLVDPLLTTSVWSSSDTDDTRSVAWGDWDGDGDLDLAVGNYDSTAIRVYENDGLGQSTSLAPIWASAETENTWSVAWGDWDGDGDLDLAAGNYGEANRVYENDGLGQASSLVSVWASADSDVTYSVAWADWDGDGDLDLAAGNLGENRVYENDGLGQATSLSSIWTSPDTDNTISIAWGDWDGDGDLDLAAGNHGEANRVYRNTGGALSSVWTSADTALTYSVAWGDLDGDGDLDLATGNWNQPNRVYENDGLGQPTSLISVWTSPDADTTASVAWGDWDGDGDLDLAAGNRGEANRVYENTGGALASVWTSADTAATRSVAWGDWDGDGDLDLVAGNDGEANRVYENTGGALASVWTSADSDITTSVAWGDWDGDGDLDLAAGNWSQPNRVYENDGLGQPGSLTPVWTSGDTDSTQSVAWGDWDGDGDLDLAAGNGGNQANRVYENDGLGQPGSLTPVWTSAETENTRSVAWGDWDGDGDLDLATGNFVEPNRVYENDGLGQPTSLASAWSSTDSDSTVSVAWGDSDGDGDLDLAAGNNGESNRAYENDGLGQPTSLVSSWTSADTDSTSSVAWGDWDGDGDLDLAAGTNNQNRVYENGWLNRPGGLPETPVSPALPERPGATDAAFFFSAAECLSSPVTVDYTLTDEESDPALSIIPEYSVSGGAGWQPATDGPGGSGTTNLPADPNGRDHTFVWDSYADSVLWGHDVRFRITIPQQASLQAGGPILRGAMSAVSPPFWICDIPADVAVTKDDGVTHVVLGQLLTYTMTVSHNGGVGAANGVRVIDDFPAALSGVAWICLEDGGGSCGASSGTGDIDIFVDLPVGTSVTFMAAGTVTAAGSEGVTNTVEVLASPTAPDPYLANNTATDVDQGWGGIFSDGFETGDTSAWSAVVP